MAVLPARSRSQSPSVRLVSVLVCLLLVTSLAAPALAAGTLESGHESVASGTYASSGYGADEIHVADSLEEANGTVEVVVRLADLSVPADASDDDATALLEDHADETQDPLLEYADERDAISVEATFWVTNAVVLAVDTDRVDLEAFERFDAVESVHRNFEVSIPEEPSVEAANATLATPPSADVDAESVSDGETTVPTTPGLELLNAPAVWDAYDTRGDGVRVAVLDTGIDAAHPDLELYTDDPADPTYPGGWAEFDAHGERIEGSTPYDSGTHGTHVSGTVAGGAANGTQIGVAPDVELLHGLVLSETSGTFAQLVAGMEWAIESDADVINMSLGASGKHSQLIGPVLNAHEAGAVVVGAIGNEGVETSGSPGNVYDAISVGAVHASGDVAAFSGGQRINRSEWHATPDSWPESYTTPDVTAHGVAVTSTVPDGEYQAMPGTSMATPHVTGAIALLLSVEPDVAPDAIATALTETAWKPAGGSELEYETDERGMDVRYGHGIVDAKAVVDSVATTPGTEAATETDAETGPGSPSNGVVTGIAAVLVVALGVAALLAVRSIGRDPDR